jgi:hypothetical protein
MLLHQTFAEQVSVQVVTQFCSNWLPLKSIIPPLLRLTFRGTAERNTPQGKSCDRACQIFIAQQQLFID